MRKFLSDGLTPSPLSKNERLNRHGGNTYVLTSVSIPRIRDGPDDVTCLRNPQVQKYSRPKSVFVQSLVGVTVEHVQVGGGEQTTWAQSRLPGSHLLRAVATSGQRATARTTVQYSFSSPSTIPTPTVEEPQLYIGSAHSERKRFSFHKIKGLLQVVHFFWICTKDGVP